MTGMTVYWITRIIELKDILQIVGPGMLSVVIVGLVWCGINLESSQGDYWKDEREATKRSVKFLLGWPTWLSILLISLNVFLPGKTDMMLIVGTDLTNKVTTEFAPELSSVRQWLNQEIQKQLDNSKENQHDHKSSN